MTENKEETRRIRFKDPDGMDFLKRYVHDFKGRKVQMLEAEKDAAVLFVNDAMEFLYTYTWGEEAYPHEVQEQFGYFTPSEFRRCIEKELGNVRTFWCSNTMCRKDMKNTFTLKSS